MAVAASTTTARGVKGTHLRDSKGIYTWKGERFPSVTTIIKAMDKPALPRWASKSVAEYVADYVSRRVPDEQIGWKDVQAHLSDSDFLKSVPWKYAEKKRDLGSLFHDLAEQIAAGVPVSVEVFEPDIRTYVEAFLDWVTQSGVEYEALECAVFSREHGYAGTMDAIVNLGGRKLVLDYKTGKDTYPEHSMQLAAYRFGEFLGMATTGDEIPMPKTDGAAVLVIGPGSCRLMEWPADEADLVCFLALRQVYEWLKSGRKPAEIMRSEVQEVLL